jgi:serine/threonine protein kinase
LIYSIILLINILIFELNFAKYSLFFLFSHSNILIKKNGRAALGDMGHSKLTQRSGPGGASKTKSLFQSKNIIFGTEGYLAPEVLERTFILEDEENDAYFVIDVWLVFVVFILRAVVAKNRAGQKVTFSDHQVS